MKSDLALVLSGGGARAAYQAGVLRQLARQRPELVLPILTGVSAGAINVLRLASHPGSFAARAEALHALWAGLRIADVFRIDGPGLLVRVLRAGLRLLSGGRGQRGAPRGMLDTSPLRALLEGALGGPGAIPGVAENLASGALDAVAITASSYSTGRSITWVETCEDCGIAHWDRAHRSGRETQLTIEHVMASAALPLLFPAVRVGDDWYGDGGIRLTAPLSPAIHLGARRILAVSTRYERSIREAETPSTEGYPPAAQVAGVLLNALFLDQFDADALRLQRINDLLREVPPAQAAELGLRRVELLVLRPSRDLGKLANDFEVELPRGFRFLTRGLGTRQTRSNDLLSLVLFQPDYLHALIALGEADAAAHADRLLDFVDARRSPSLR